MHKKYLLGSTLVTSLLLVACSFLRPQAAPIPEIQTLADDMAYYKFLSPPDTGQAGDLLEHSLWVHYATQQLFQENSPFIDGYTWTERDKQLLGLAGFLHDVGKAGRDDLLTSTDNTKAYQCCYDWAHHLACINYHFDHEAHAMIGFDYIVNPTQRTYRLQTGATYDFSKLFNALGITQREISIIAVLVGIHYTFGKLRPQKITNDEFIALVNKLATAAGYGNADEYLLRLSVLIQVADVRGMTYVAPQKTLLFPNAPDKHAVRPTSYQPWERYGYSTSVALDLFHALINRFLTPAPLPAG